MRVRREVLGDDHVDRAIESTTGQTAGLPGLHHPLRVGRDLVPARARPPHAKLHHADGARRAGPVRGARAPHPRRTPERRVRRRDLGGAAAGSGLLRRPAANSAFAVVPRVLDETRLRDAGRHRRRRARGAHARAAARARRHRERRARGPQPRLRRAADPRGRARAGHGRAAARRRRRERMDREGIVHHGINLQFDGERHYVPLTELSGGARSSSTARRRS
jgi:hypothetical protein